jgi:hypothetical protein
VPVGAHFLELVSERGFSNEATPTLPKSVLNCYLTASERLPASIHVPFLLEDRKKTTRLTRKIHAL